jgi:hypothetical protein
MNIWTIRREERIDGMPLYRVLIPGLPDFFFQSESDAREMLPHLLKMSRQIESNPPTPYVSTWGKVKEPKR